MEEGVATGSDSVIETLGFLGFKIFQFLRRMDSYTHTTHTCKGRGQPEEILLDQQQGKEGGGAWR